jgi:outer membrane lipoprotein-sorting protein
MTRFMPLLLLAVFPLAGQSLEDVFSRIDKAAQSFKALTADMKRVSHTAVINDDSVESGSIKLKRVKAHDTRMLIDFTGVDAKTIALDGSAVQIYYPKINTVQVYELGNNRNLVDQFLLLGFGAGSADLKNAYNTTFAGSEDINGQKTGHIQLVPKSNEVLQKLKKAELWIADSGLPMQQKFVTSATGDYILVTYSNVRVNPSLSDSALKLKLPKGVKTEHPQK